MTTFDRSRFKAASIEANKKVTDEVNKALSTPSERGDYHKITDGVNLFRLLPPHEPDSPSFFPKVVYWLDCEVEEVDDDGKTTGKTSIKKRPIFDSRIHGGTPKDIIDEYIKFTKKTIFDTIQDKDLRTKQLSPINGWKGKDGKWNSGILASKSFVCYATKGDIIPANIGRLELWEKDKQDLEKLNFSEDSDEPIVTDSFSDPDEGVQFQIKKGVDDKNKNFTLITKVSFSAPRGAKGNEISKAYEDFVKTQRVPDEVLQKLSEMTPLSTQFKNSYKRSDFERALKALQMFDQKHGYQTFENDEFLDIVEEIDKYYSNSDSSITSVEEVKKIKEEISYEDMTREELKIFIKENNLGIKILPSMTRELIIEMITEVLGEGSGEDTEESSNPKEELSENSDNDPGTKQFEELMKKTKESSLPEEVSPLSKPKVNWRAQVDAIRNEKK